MSNYDDIIFMNRPKSQHPSMSGLDRAAQFAPFSALVGYKEAIAEATDYTEIKKELSIEQSLLLNEKLIYLKDKIKEKPKVKITYFALKRNSTEGNYQTEEAVILKIDELYQTITLDNKRIISFMDVMELDFDY